MGHYNLHLGGDRIGERLNEKYRDNLDEEGILSELDFLFETFSKERSKRRKLWGFCSTENGVVNIPGEHGQER